MPTTLHLDARHPADIARAAAILRDGGTVAFATETVYGLGANALSATAVAKIFLAKDRPAWDPLIVHIPSTAALSAITDILTGPDLQHRVTQLAEAFWPGPLTLLLPRTTAIPGAVTAGRPLVGVRVPSHPAAQALLKATGLPIAAPSANTFGHTSPTTAAHVLADLDGRIDAVLDAGPTTLGLESTVLDPSPTPMVLYRPGAITPEQITTVTGVPVRVFRAEIILPTEISLTDPQESLPSPGVGLRHYAPRARLILLEGTQSEFNEIICNHPTAPGERPSTLLPTNWNLDCDPTKILVEPWAPWNDPNALAATLFAGLRALDDRGATLIFCPLPTPGGLADAIRDRLQKAARSA